MKSGSVPADNNKNAVTWTVINIMFNTNLPGKSWLAAVSTAIILGVYLLTADITNINDPNKNQTPTDSSQASTAEASITEASITEDSLPTVNARPFNQELIPRTLALYGRTGPDRIITVSSELAARIVGVKAERGAMVRAGETLITLREGNLRAELKSARAQVKKPDWIWTQPWLCKRKT